MVSKDLFCSLLITKIPDDTFEMLQSYFDNYNTIFLSVIQGSTGLSVSETEEFFTQIDSLRVSFGFSSEISIAEGPEDFINYCILLKSKAPVSRKPILALFSINKTGLSSIV